MKWYVRAAIFLAGATVTSLLFINLCDLVYQCGCRSLWAGAADHCNIHDHTPGAKHCPICNLGTTGYMAVFGAVLAAQGLTAARGPGATVLHRLGATVVAFPVVFTVLALGLGVWVGYWN